MHPMRSRSVTILGSSRKALAVAILAVLTFIASVLPASASSVTFVGARSFDVGDLPDTVVTGDFNGDADFDVAVTNRNTNDVSVLLGNGDGTFEAATDFPVGGQPMGLATGYLDDDLFLDLVSSGINSVSVLLANGDGTFEPAVDVSLNPGMDGSWQSAVTTADLNGDSITDIAVVNNTTDVVSVLLGEDDGIGNATGTFADAESVGVGTGPWAVTTGDLDGQDGIDLAVANAGSGDVSILLNDGAGSFVEDDRVPVGSAPVAVVTGDFVGNGSIDVVVGNVNSDYIRIFHGAVPGSFEDFDDVPVGSGSHSLVAGDFDDDTGPDLAVANSITNDISLLLSGGAEVPDFVGRAGPLSIATGDFDEDSNADLVTANALGDVSVLLGDGGGSFDAATSLNIGPGFITDGASADFNGDSWTDLAMGLSSSGIASVSVILSAADEDAPWRFEDPVDLTVNGASDVITADVDDDGNADLVVADGFYVEVLLGIGDGSFGDAEFYATGDSSLAVAAGDLSADGVIDLVVVRESTDTVSVLYGDGDGTFGPPTDLPVGDGPGSVAIGDFDGDENNDLAVANRSSNTVSIFLFESPDGGDDGLVAMDAVGVGNSPLSITSGDFNYDEDEDGEENVFTDLAVANRVSDSVSILLSNGDGTFEVENLLVGSPASITTGSFNGDSRPDLAVSQEGLLGVSILLGDGDGSFELGTTLAAGFSRAHAVADLDHDGDGDVAVTSAEPRLAIFPNVTAPTSPIPSITELAPNSPANDNDVVVKGIAEAGATVRVYKSRLCMGTPLATGTAADFGSVGLIASVTDDTLTRFRVTAAPGAGPDDNESACSEPSDRYAEDSTVVEPEFDVPTPPSGSNDNAPFISGGTEQATVSLYATPDCSGPALATGNTDEFNSPGLQINVENNSTTTIRAKIVDGAGNILGCSTTSVTYAEVTPPPPPPPVQSPTASPSPTPSASPSPTVAPTPEPTVSPTPEPEIPACEDDPSALCVPDGDHDFEADSQTILVTEGSGDIVITGSGNTIVIDPGFTGTITVQGCGNTVIGAAGDDDLTVDCTEVDAPAALGLLAQVATEPNVVSGGAGDDTIRNLGTAAELRGERGDDRIYGNNGDEEISGGRGRDFLRGAAGNDEIRGGDGDDRIFGGRGDDELWSGRGLDRINCGPGRDKAHSKAKDEVMNCERRS